MEIDYLGCFSPMFKIVTQLFPFKCGNCTNSPDGIAQDNLYTRNLVHIGLKGNGLYKSTETRFDWNVTGYNELGLYLAHSMHSKLVHADAIV